MTEMTPNSLPGGRHARPDDEVAPQPAAYHVPVLPRHARPEFESPIDLEALERGSDALLHPRMLAFFKDGDQVAATDRAARAAKDDRARDYIEWGRKTTMGLIIAPEQAVALTRTGVAEIAEKAAPLFVGVRSGYTKLDGEVESAATKKYGGPFSELVQETSSVARLLDQIDAVLTAPPEYGLHTAVRLSDSLVDAEVMAARLNRNEVVAAVQLLRVSRLVDMYALGKRDTTEAVQTWLGRAEGIRKSISEATGDMLSRTVQLKDEVNGRQAYGSTNEKEVNAAVDAVLDRGATSVEEHIQGCNDDSERMFAEIREARGVAETQLYGDANEVGNAIFAMSAVIRRMPHQSQFSYALGELLRSLETARLGGDHSVSLLVLNVYLTNARRELAAIESSVTGWSAARQKVHEAIVTAQGNVTALLQRPVFQTKSMPVQGG